MFVKNICNVNAILYLTPVHSKWNYDMHQAAMQILNKLLISHRCAN